MATSGNESRIVLDEVSPVEIYGVNDRFLDRIRSYFPKLKIVARGTEMMVSGSVADRKRFLQRFNDLVSIKKTKGTLGMEDVDRLFDVENFPQNPVVEREDLLPDSAYTIVYGNEGRVVKAFEKSEERSVL